MKLTYSVMLGDEYYEKHIFEGSAGEILVAWDALFGNGEEPDRCPKCGGVMEGECLCEPEPEVDRRCQTCGHDQLFPSSECGVCFFGYSNWVPKESEPERLCQTCAYSARGRAYKNSPQKVREIIVRERCTPCMAGKVFEYWEEATQPRRADPSRPPCPLTGRSCATCWWLLDGGEMCRTCGEHFAHYEPAPVMSDLQGQYEQGVGRYTRGGDRGQGTT